MVGLHVGIRSDSGRRIARGAGRIFSGCGLMESEEQASPTGHYEKESNEKANYLPLVMIVTPAGMSILPIRNQINHKFLHPFEAVRANRV